MARRALPGSPLAFGLSVGGTILSELEIRRYEPRDAETVWDLHVRALGDAGAYDEEYAHLDADLRRVEATFLESGGEFLVGEVDGDVVAMGALQPASAVDHHESGTSTGVVRRMRVDPDHQRRGYGTAILDRLEERAVELGFERLVLDTTPRQSAAIAFYERHGYRETRREDAGPVEMIYYVKAIG